MPINLFISSPPLDLDFIKSHRTYILEEVLGSKIDVCEKSLKRGVVFEFNNYKMYIVIQQDL